MKQLLSLVTTGNTGGSAGGLSLQGTPIVLPKDIANVNHLAGTFGINIIRLGVDLIIFAAVLLALGFIFYAGFKWMTSEGDKKKIEEARTTLIYSVVGLIVVSLAFLTISVLGAFFNVPLISQ